MGWWTDSMGDVALDAAFVPPADLVESNIVYPTVNVLDAAQADYLSGKITQDQLIGFKTDMATLDKKTTGQIAKDTAAIEEKYSYSNLYVKPVVAAAGAVSDSIKNVLALGLVALALFLLVQGKALAKS